MSGTEGYAAGLGVFRRGGCRLLHGGSRDVAGGGVGAFSVVVVSLCTTTLVAIIWLLS